MLHLWLRIDVREGINQTYQVEPPTQEPGSRNIRNYQRKRTYEYLRVEFKEMGEWASVTFWSNKLQEKKRTVGKSDVKLCSVENREIEPVVEERIEDIRNQLLGLGDEDYEIYQETVKENGKPEEDSTCISKKEKILDE